VYQVGIHPRTVTHLSTNRDRRRVTLLICASLLPLQTKRPPKLLSLFATSAAEKINKLEMSANAHRDGRPAEYRWRRLLNAAVWLTPATTVPCRNAAKTRNPLKFAGCSKLTNRSQPLVGQSSHYYEDEWRGYCCLTCFFPVVDICLSCEDIARQNCAMVPRWRFLATFCVLYLQQAACNIFQTCILNSH